MAFHVGQKVKYVGPKFNHHVQTTPDPGAQYTVRAVGDVMGESAILLNEIINDPRIWFDGVYELMMNANLFRPIVARKTDISIFTDMLIPAQHKESV